MNAAGKPLKVIFNEALDRTDPAERARYLAAACGTNLDLRRQAEELIAAHDRAGGDLLPTQQSDAPATVLGASALIEQPGTRIGRYKLLENIGEGGFGVVYMAEQREPVKRRVALKIIKLGMDTKQTVARFEAERQALAMMDHPNIAKVFDAGATDTGRPYFVMELVRGIPMTKFCDENSLTTEERLDLFVQVCQAIQHAHQKGIIHRDIKPSNVLVTLHDEKAVPKVIDFGIAKATQQDLTEKTLFTQFQQFIGTPAYMSPEQAQMSGLDIDTRSDIYSLGVLLYELLTGTTPFDPKELLSGGYEEIRRRIREEEPARPSTRVSTMEQQRLTTLAKYRKCDPGKLKAALRGDLDWIVMKAMEKDRTRRYDTANGLAMDIKRFLQQEPVVARPPNTAYRIQKFVRRNQATVVGGAVILVALVLGLSLAAIGWWQASAERDKAVKARAAEEVQRLQAQASERKAEEAQTKEAQLRQRAETQELAARRRAYAADMNILHQALRVNNLRRARQLLDRHRPKPGELDLRGWEWRYLWQRCQGDAEFKLCQQPVRVLYGGFTPDGKRVATFDDVGRIRIWDVATRSEVAQLQGAVFAENELRANSGQASLSPEGEWMAATGKGLDGQPVVKVWKVASGEIEAEFPCEGGRVAAVAFSPNGRQLAVYVQDRAVFLWNLGTRALDARLPVLTTGIVFYGAVKFSPDGKILAIGEANGNVRLVEATSANELAALTASTTQGVMTLAFSPDSQWLAVGVGANDPVVSVWDVATRTKMRGLTGHTGFVIHLAFSPDGRTLASASADETIKLWSTTTWQEEVTLLDHDDEVWSVSYSRDGKKLVSTGKDGAVFVWSLSSERANRGSRTLAAPVAPSFRYAGSWDVSPDSTTIAILGLDGRVSLWDAFSLEQKSMLSALGTNNSAVFWSETGHLLVGDEEASQIKIWNLASGTGTSHSLNTGGQRLVWRFLPTLGTLVIATPDDRNVRTWSIEGRREISLFTLEGRMNDLAVSSEAPLMAIGTGLGEILVLNLVTERFENIFKAHRSSVQGLSFLPGSRLLASASPAAPTIKIWDLSATNEVAALPGFNLVIGRIAASPDGKRLAASSIGQEPIKIWDTTSWEEVANLQGSGTSLAVARFFPDGNTLAAFDLNRTLHFFRAPSNEEIAAAEKSKAH